MMNVEPGFRISYLRIRFSLIVAAVGLFVFVIGAKPNWFGWDRSPVVGFIQIAVFLVGLAMICAGGYVGLLALWGKGQRSILADIGSRLVSTGYVIAVFTGMADIFGLGSQPLPMVPHFGPWQSSGVLIGQIVIAVGLLMMVPYRAPASDAQ
ncbi:MAG: hypothetical protein DCC56_15385 [Anaerolineae bacterium]|nr:hypothetical protein [Anaerolineales bacterium]RIK28647.1 MAG: hypothetical protein DCC56_15385 [Anaerolineae bacterium]WKZ45595.1 MAG: hypothetical protein QY302_07365 [Anaerolineales bacterium]WKZ48217.1 MAG: hypothetical protein QY306_02475 [Anaerolineales bacterium]